MSNPNDPNAYPSPWQPGGSHPAPITSAPAPSHGTAAAAAASQHSESLAGPAPTHAARRRIMGIQPVLFVGMLLLVIVSIVTIVLIFIGSFESQAPRVIWTVAVFLAFTGLLALDLVWSRRDPLPLVLGVIANTYMLGLLMIAIWVQRPISNDSSFSDVYYDGGWLFFSLFWVVVVTVMVVRAAAGAAYGLIRMGKAGQAQVAVVVGYVAASLVGLTGILLTAHFGFEVFGVDVGEWYWRGTVATIVVAALSSCITLLLYWNRRNVDYQDALDRGEDPDALRKPSSVQPESTAVAAPFAAQQPPAAQPAPALLPWPRFPDGTPVPAGPDGQPDPRYLPRF